MKFDFDERESELPFVDLIYRTQSEGGGQFMSSASSQWEIVITQQRDKTTLTMRGPETKARPAPVPEDADITGIIFKHGTYMPHLPVSKLVNAEVHMPEISNRKFWLNSSAWEFPTYDNADVFLNRLMKTGLIEHDPVVEAVLRQHRLNISERTIRRHFLQATGLAPKTLYQIERARQAVALLEQGKSILDTVYEVGYFDQPHMTHALKLYAGQTPAQIAAALSPV